MVVSDVRRDATQSIGGDDAFYERHDRFFGETRKYRRGEDRRRRHAELKMKRKGKRPLRDRDWFLRFVPFNQ